MDKCGQRERELDRQMLARMLESERQHLASPYDGFQRFAEDPDPPLPCHYFDYVIGTSTGGCVPLPNA